MSPLESTEYPLLLGLDTSTSVTSIAIARGERVLFSTTHQQEDRRSESLWLDLKSDLDHCGVSLNQVDGFVVCLGPGAFTGLRVGVAAIKGLSLATGKPAAGISSLEASAFAANRTGFVCALVNAYKGEVYSQMFSFDERGAPVALNEALVSTSTAAIERVADVRSLTFAGDAVGAFEALILGAAEGGEWTLAGSKPLAESLVKLAVRKREVWRAALKACYIRPAEAEVKLAAGLLGSKIKRTLSGDQI